MAYENKGMERFLAKFFEDLPEDDQELDQHAAALLIWDTTPIDLRDTDEKSLKQWVTRYAEENPEAKMTVSVAMKLRSQQDYKIRRRELSARRGEFDHKIGMALDVIYERVAKDGSVTASTTYLSFYEEQTKEHLAGLTVTPSMGIEEVASSDVAHIDTAELERLLADEGANDG